MAEQWDGERWSALNLHFGDPFGITSALMDVSCLSRTTCAVAGWDDIGLCTDLYYSVYDVPVLGFGTSPRWSLKRQPNIQCAYTNDNHGGVDLYGVSCTSTAACIAVGNAVYRWDGHHWSLQSAPIGIDHLNAIACTSSNACTAVGSKAYMWNGRNWSTAPVARPARAADVELSGVACLSRASCVAVGHYEDRGQRSFLLVESTGVKAGARHSPSKVAAAGTAVATSAQRLSERR